MKFTLKNYQEKAVNSLKDRVYNFLSFNDSEKRIITFKAPTGSGKTVMMASFIENLIESNKDLKNIDFTFLWLSIGTGDLHNQSKKSLEKNIGDNIKIQSIDEVYGTSQHELLKDSVMVSNWEKVWTKNKKTGDWKSIAMRDGDYINFREILNNTNSIGRKIVLIIDESYIATDAARGREIVDLINPNIVIEVSATPNLRLSGKDIIDNKGWIEEINPQDVIDEEMIKDQIIVNSDFVLFKKDDSDQTVLRSAINKRDELVNLYKEYNINVNPLLLIQLPNSRDGESAMEMVLDFLEKEKGVKQGDDRLAIWLSEKDISDRNIDNISKNNSKQEYLIFKQAIATGWDCPRAQILLKFREVKSDVFEIQVLGSILRTPEQKHYSIEALNKAYVYVNSDEISFKIEDYNAKILGDLPSIRKRDYKDIKLNSFYQERKDYQDIKSEFKKVLSDCFIDKLNLIEGDYNKNIKKLEKEGWKFELEDIYHKVISDISVDVKTIDQYYLPVEDDTKETLNISDRQIEIISRNIFKKLMNPFTNIARSIPVMNLAWYAFCRNIFGENLMKKDFISSQTLLIMNLQKVQQIFIEAVEKYSKIKKKKLQAESEHYSIFEIPKIDYFNSELVDNINYDKYILDNCYLYKDRSKPERDFENLLNNSKKVKWWYKNGVNRDDYFGIKYEYDNKDGKETIHTFYPDYVVKFNDEKIGIFETKAESDPDAHTKTKVKAEELYKYIQKENKIGKKLLGGIVVFKEKENKWRIQNKKEYSLTEGWEELIF